MKRGLCLTLAALALLLCTACGGNERLDALEAQVSSMEDALSQSEAQRVSDAYDFQRQLEALTAVGEQGPSPERHSGSGVALRAGEVHSVLIIGDSISDGNGDGGSYAEQSKRAELGGRLVLEAAGERYYEKPQDQQGWVKHFRNYLKNTSEVSVFTTELSTASPPSGSTPTRSSCSQTTIPAMTLFLSCWAPMTVGTA